MQTEYLTARFVDFARKGCWLLMIIFAVFVIYYAVWYAYMIVLEPFFRPLYQIVRNCLIQGTSHDDDHAGEAGGTVNTFEAAEAKIKERIGLSSYDLKDNEKYKNAHKAMQETDLKAHIREKTLHPKVPEGATAV